MAKDLYHDLVKRALQKDGSVPHFVYQTFFNLTFINSVVQRSQLNLLVYDLDKESIEQWIK